MLMVHRTFLGMTGEEKLKNPSLISMQCGEGAHGEQKTTKAFFLFLFFSFSFTDVLFPAFPLLFSLFFSRLQISLTIVKPR